MSARSGPPRWRPRRKVVVAAAAGALALTLLGQLAPWDRVASLLKYGTWRFELQEVDGAVRPVATGPEAPLPDWTLLPEGGRIVTAAVLPAIDGAGAGSAVVLAIDDADAFVARYGTLLRANGYLIRPGADAPAGLLGIDRSLAADHPKTGRRVGIMLYHDSSGPYVQLTFLEPSARPWALTSDATGIGGPR